MRNIGEPKRNQLSQLHPTKEHCTHQLHPTKEHCSHQLHPTKERCLFFYTPLPSLSHRSLCCIFSIRMHFLSFFSFLLHFLSCPHQGPKC